MVWQDIVIAIVNVVFAVSLIPQVIHGFRKKRGEIVFLASVPTFIGLYIITFAFFTLELYFSSIVSFFVGTMWFLLFIQRLIYKNT